MSESPFNKVAGLRPAALLKKRLWHWCFPVNFEKFLITSFSQNISGRLLLAINMFSRSGDKHLHHRLSFFQKVLERLTLNKMTNTQMIFSYDFLSLEIQN